MNYAITKNGGECVITLDGDLKAPDQAAFKDLLDECSSGGTTTCRVDLSRVENIDSTGLGLLLMLQDSMKKAGGSVILANARKAARHAFELARFDELFTLE